MFSFLFFWQKFVFNPISWFLHFLWRHTFSLPPFHVIGVVGSQRSCRTADRSWQVSLFKNNNNNNNNHKKNKNGEEFLSVELNPKGCGAQSVQLSRQGPKNMQRTASQSESQQQAGTGFKQVVRRETAKRNSQKLLTVCEGNEPISTAALWRTVCVCVFTDHVVCPVVCVGVWFCPLWTHWTPASP